MPNVKLTIINAMQKIKSNHFIIYITIFECTTRQLLIKDKQKEFYTRKKIENTINNIAVIKKKLLKKVNHIFFRLIQKNKKHRYKEEPRIYRNRT